MDFKATVESLLERLDYDPRNITEQILGFRQRDGELEDGSALPTTPVEKLQVSTLSAIIRASMDMHRLDTIACDNPASEVRASALLKNDKINVALINRQRRDVAGPDERGSALARRTLKWEHTKLTTTLIVNDRARAEHLYERVAWQKEILTSIRACMEQDANFVCFGEFDYPPLFPNREASHQFEDDIFSEIDSVDRGVIVFAGSRHVCEKESATYRDEEVTEFSAHNVGHVFFNKKTLDGMWHPDGGRMQKVYKRTPASKVGEQLSRREDISLCSFSTVLGRVAFLICSDAYDPTILLEIFAKSAAESEKPDIIFVPSYNTSPKLALMCQILSLMTDSIVILLDACMESADSSEKAVADLWNCGMPAGSANGITLKASQELKSRGVLQVWELDWNVIKEFRLACTASTTLPLFDQARRVVQIRRPNLN